MGVGMGRGLTSSSLDSSEVSELLQLTMDAAEAAGREASERWTGRARHNMTYGGVVGVGNGRGWFWPHRYE